jgi:uncharacterized membrane protein YfcA
MLLFRAIPLNEVNLWALGGVGLVAGLLGSMLGVGGGILIVPILTLALHLPIKVAIASSLVAIVANSCTAAGMYTKARVTNIRLGLLLETTTTPGAIIGGFIAAVIAPSILSALFGLVLIYAAYIMITRQHLMYDDTQPDSHIVQNNSTDNLSTSLASSYYDRNLDRVITYKVTRIPVGLGTSFFAGILSSLLGVGGGIVNVPVMHLVMGVPMKVAIATSAFIITITATAGALIYYYYGHIYPFIIAPLTIGVVIGSRIGVELTQRAGGIVLRRIFGALLIIVAAMMFFKIADII